MENIKTVRTLLNRTPEQFAEDLGVSLSMYEKVEYGYIEASKKMIKNLKEKYPFVDVNYFFTNKVQNK
jgi:transcriptional regulator with XRE-family HTH domain